MSEVCLYEWLKEKLDQLVYSNPERLQVEARARTADGREILEAVLGSTQSRYHILIQAAIHGREYMNALLAVQQIEEALKNYNELLEQVCFHVLPMSNPDGVVISQRGIEGIRHAGIRKELEQCYQNDMCTGKAEKNRKEYWKRWKANARGVDLNRNFDSGWELFQGVSIPSADHYKGPYPESEPEVRAILSVAEEYPLTCTVSYHSSGNVIYWDYGCGGELLDQDRKLAQTVSRVTGYEQVSSVQDAQDGAGCSDYFVLERGIPSVTIENGAGECPLSMEEYPSIWSANRFLWPALERLYAR
ncbi:peptidase [Ruminococcus sp. OA3]|uniref:M14 family zinc carboxypeptidase n=1 Tax=Ruminococcus sp. OA3 TaxID=2914164 RepID=UPI001F052F46|nr:M14 family zinc carboxypeptidase [Ruminococcus sp. OA3]MCH1981140.1 peptidase [Ruminococcus sp. OA3]